MPTRHDHANDDDLLTRAEAAKILRVSERTIDRWAENGRIRRERTPGGKPRFRRSSVMATLKDDQPAA